MSAICPRTLRKENQEGPTRSAEVFDFYWGFLPWFGACRSIEPNGIQEVGSSILLSSTNKIKAFLAF
jgi:hypothetical protein